MDNLLATSSTIPPPTFAYTLEEVWEDIQAAALPVAQQLAQLKLKFVIYILIHVLATAKTPEQEKPLRKALINKMKTLNIIGSPDMNQVSSVAGRFYKLVLSPSTFKTTPPPSLLEVKRELKSFNQHNKESSAIVTNTIAILERHGVKNLTNLRDLFQKYSADTGMYKCMCAMMFVSLHILTGTDNIIITDDIDEEQQAANDGILLGLAYVDIPKFTGV